MGNAASIGGYGYPIWFEGGLYRYANKDLHLHSVRLGGPVCSSPGDCQNMAALVGGHTVSRTKSEIAGDTFGQRHEIVKRSPVFPFNIVKLPVQLPKTLKKLPVTGPKTLKIALPLAILGVAGAGGGGG